ncbi:Cna B-type domain-containing protein, partial [Facklamia hominis]
MKKLYKILPLLVGSFLLTPTVGRAAEITDNPSLVNDTGIENKLQPSANHQTLPLPDSVSELADQNYEELVDIPDQNQSKSEKNLLEQAEPTESSTTNEDHLDDHKSSGGDASPSKREDSRPVLKDHVELHPPRKSDDKSAEFRELSNRSELVDNEDRDFIKAEFSAGAQNKNQSQEPKTALHSDEEPITNGQSEEVIEVTVETFEELLRAIEEAKEGVLTRIRITSNLEITKKVMIPAGKRIILTSNYQQEVDEAWKKVEQAADYADQGEARQREIIEEARKRAEEANDLANLAQNPLPDPHRTVQIKRASSFIDDSLFQIVGKLQLGDTKTALHVNGNNEVTTQIAKGVLFNVESGGHFILKNGTLMQVNNHSGYSAPIAIENGGRFDMVGGRIVSNESRQVKEPWGRPTSAGAVYVNPGGQFNLSNGLIDNNKSSTGGVFVGSLFGGSSDAVMHMTGGIIANNRAVGPYALGGAINGFPRADIQIDDGIIAHNQSGQSKSSGWGGGIVMTNQRISPWSNTIDNEYASIPKPNSKSLREIRSQLTLNGGLIANNRANKGGGLYLDSDNVYFNKTMLLDNIAYQFGGGFYVSFPPHAQELNQLLITENKANQGMLTAGIDQVNTGGGIWNCPTGYVHIGDGHTVYAFNNQAKNLGDDLRFSKKTGYFKLTVGGKDYYIENKFYSHVSPVTKGYKEHTTLELIKFLNDTDHGDSIPDRLSYNASWMALKAIYSKALQVEAWRNAKTFIIGNQASNGGGIGSNANMETPNDEGSYDLELTKKWESQISMSDRKSVTADIFIVPVGTTPEDVRNNYGSNPRYFKYGEVELNEKNDWTQRFSQSQYGRLDQLLEEMKNYGLPYNKNAVNDKGLPFTAAELKAKGFKFLVVERDSHGFISTVEEVEPRGALEPGSRVGQLTIGRPDTGVHSNYQGYWFNNTDVHLYYINQQEQAERLGLTNLSEANGFKGQISHPFLSQVTETQFYGTDYKFQAWGESWAKAGYTGFSISENGYSLFLVKNKTGYTLYIPYLMIQDMDSDNQYTGWDIHLGEGQVSEQSPKVEERHQFFITNSKSGGLPVQKTWHKDIPEDKRPKSVIVYLLYKGHRVKIGNDENGNPIYRSLTLTAENNWKGSFDQIDPNELAQGNYSIEESARESYDARIKSHFEQEFEFRVHYADSYREGEYDIAVNRHFYPFSGDIKLKLYHEDQLVDSKVYTWKSQSDEYGTFYWLEKEVIFGQGNKKLLLNNYGRDVRVKYYDRVGNTPGRSSYNFYLKRDADGFYSLYVPRLFVNGLPQAMFEVRGTSKENIHGLENYPLISSLTGKSIGADVGIELKNYPTIEIQAKKIWENGQAIDKPQVEMILKQNGSEINRQLLDLRSNQVVWHNLKKYDEQGNLYIYTIEESFQSDHFKQSNVNQTGNVFTFTNTYEVPKTHFEVRKVWSGGPSIKPTIQLQLLRNGQAYGTVVELLNGQRRYRWDDLSATDEEGNPYVYSVEELAVAGYTSTIGPVQDHQVTITNTYEVPKTHFEVRKVWSGGPSIKPT